MADSQSILLDTFRDNNAQLITAADMRQFINAVYDEKVAVDKIIDNLESNDTTSVLSAYQGKVLNGLITILQAQITTNTNTLATGVSGTFTTSTEAVTVTNGLITSITPI